MWISHLDLAHTLQRAFSRAGYRIGYSEGFNPHPLMSIALPLSVGTESVCEILDVKMEEMPEKSNLNAVLPEGIEILDIYEQETKASEIKWLEVEGFLSPSRSEWKDLFDRDSVVINKKTKSGFSDVDIKPMIKKISYNDDGFRALVSAQNPTLNPQSIADAIAQLMPSAAPETAKFKRLEIYDADMKEFR